MSHKLKEDDPLFYKKALMGLFDSAKENGIDIKIKDSCIVFESKKDGIVNKSCSLEVVTEYENPLNTLIKRNQFW